MLLLAAEIAVSRRVDVSLLKVAFCGLVFEFFLLQRYLVERAQIV